MWNLKQNKTKQKKKKKKRKTETKFMDTQSRLVVAREKEGWRMGKMGKVGQKV